MIKTFQGLPNTCASCAARIDPAVGWFAEHEDAARSGIGYCANCEAKRVAAERVASPTIETNAPAQNVVVVEALRNKEGEFVSPHDQDADGKPERIVHAKRSAKSKQKAK